MRRGRPVQPVRHVTLSPEEIARIHNVFKSSVSKVVSAKRMWAQLWTELDKAEETDIRSKFELKRSILQAVTAMSGGAAAPRPSASPAPSIASSANAPLDGDGHPLALTEEATRRRRSFARKTVDAKVLDADVYNDIPGVSLHFLWDMTHAQHTARQRIKAHPARGKTAHDFEIAQLPPLTDSEALTPEWVELMISEFKQERVLAYNDAFQIVRRAAATFIREPNVVPVKIPRGSSIAVVGDLHGQLDDLLMIFREAGKPGEGNRVLFNGDFVDRGAYSCEIVLTLLAFRALYPHALFLNRGNHECADMNSVDGFQRECEAKYDTALYTLFNHVFACLPIAHLITVGQQRVFVVHAGLSFKDVTIADVNAEDRYQLVFPMNSILQDLLWSDPYDGMGRIISKRGAGCQFGADVAARFLVKNNIHLIIRSHECEDNGFALWFENRLYTIFSASDYCGDSNNYGAFCVLSDAPAPQIRVYMARKQVLHYGDRMQRQRQAIISRLLVRIVGKIDDIERRLIALADARGTPGRVPRAVWSHVLQEMLLIDAPFILIGERLGVPASAVRKPGVLFDVKRWTSRFRPRFDIPASSTATAAAALPATAAGAASPASPGAAASLPTKADDLRLHLSALLFDPASPFREGLEALFLHFDVNRDGSITPEEFKAGVGGLMKYLGKEYDEEAMDALVHAVDANEDGEIDYNEFFSAFAYGDVDVEHEQEVEQ
jgi:diadenosine tetraphosphatase ApaH/serine/threonine PP2A family protein phosphatase